MGPISKRYYLIKFGRQDLPETKLELRNGSFELIGTCATTDWTGLGRMIAPNPFPESLKSQVQALEIGKILKITL